MSTVSFRANVGRTRAARRGVRLAAVLAGVLAALAIVALAKHLSGLDLYHPAFDYRSPRELTSATLAVVAALASFAGWGLLAVLERFGAHAHRTWTVIAVVALVLSLAGPLSGHGVTAGNRFALVLITLGVGAAVILLLLLTASRGDQPEVA